MAHNDFGGGTDAAGWCGIMMEAVALQDEAVYDFEEMSVEDFPSKPWQGVGVVGDGDCHCHWFGCDGQ